jgi:hypothetical protein
MFVIGNLQYIFVQTDKTGLTEYQVEVLQCFRHPETFALIELLSRLPFRDRRMSILSVRRVVNGFKHAPCSVLQICLACDPVQDED